LRSRRETINLVQSNRNRIAAVLFLSGTIYPHGCLPAPMFLAAKPEEKSGRDIYWIMISAQNGTVF
jgi:hypothetical protein